MRRLICSAAFAILAACAAVAQPAVTQPVTGQTVAAQQPAGTGKAKVLFVFEEENEKLGPWIASFRDALRAANVTFDECPAKDAPSVDLAKYDAILVYGAVMAFTASEPVRDWLSKETRLGGKRVVLVVTANRWFLKKYHGQLTDLLGKQRAVTVDAVTSATKTLSSADRNALVKTAVSTVARGTP